MTQNVSEYVSTQGLCGDEKEAKDDQTPCIVNRHNPEEPILEALFGFDLLHDIMCCRRCRRSGNGSEDERGRHTYTEGQQSSPNNKDGHRHHDERRDENLFAIPTELWKRQGSA